MNCILIKLYIPRFFVMTLLLIFNQSFKTEAQSGEEYKNLPFFEDFNEPVDPAVWQVATWEEHGGQTGTERCFAKDGFLHLVLVHDSRSGKYFNSAIQTVREFLYGKWEIRAKPSGIPGILNSIYTIDWNNTADSSSSDNGTKQEVDIEFLTYTFNESFGEVHFAVHAAGKSSFNRDIRLTFNPSADFYVWGFEITPEQIQWFVDDEILYTYVYSENDISITAPYQFKLNTWTEEHWIKGPPEPDIECLYLIDWIKFTPYSESAR
jgi:beta-glucanase (GH16 family)